MENKIEKENKQKNVRVTLHTYREGGSMVCDEQKVNYEVIPTRKIMENLIATYKRAKNYNGIVFYNISGWVEGERN